jgi:predicted regulator of Ras-like GTPase activity (Roadblock/LC7/MglB family)
MPTIRELVTTIRHREGVDAAVVLGRDGLLIDGQGDAALDLEHVAAHIPSILTTADEFAAASARGALTSAILELASGIALVSVLSEDAVLLVLLQPGANVGPLLYELRRNREQMASLV